MERCEILVAGGGPAGSTAARFLSRAGMDVIVIDKAVFPRPKVCAGWVTPSVFSDLGIDPDDYGKGRTIQPITGFRVGRFGAGGIDEGVEVRYGHVVSYGILRSEFDDFLLRSARKSGARLVLGESLTSLARYADGWMANGKIRAAAVIGAGGHFCPVARLAGLMPAKEKKPERAVAAMEAEFLLTPREAVDCGIDGKIPELFFLDDLSGYAWCIRKGDRLNIGLGKEGPGAAALFGEFVRHLAAMEKIPGGGVEGAARGHAYLLKHRSRRRLSDDGVLLVGDAAGLAGSRSGEGIRPAVESGMIAASVLAGAQGCYDGERLRAYDSMIEDRFGPRGRGETVAAGFPPGLKRWLARCFFPSGFLVRHLLMDRWFLQSAVPPLTDLFPISRITDSRSGEKDGSASLSRQPL